MIPYGKQSIDEDDIRAVVEVLRSDWLTTGPRVSEFEQAFADVVGTKEAVAVNSGTAALHAAMFALGVGPGDEVIVPAMTFAATANCVVFQGATPVFADVDPGSLLISPGQVEAKISSRTRAVIAVDYTGHPADYDVLRSITDQHGIALVADACHALGASYRGRPAGSLADLTAFSFHPVKHITTGEGGMVTTNHVEMAKKMRLFRSHGISSGFREREQQGSWYYEMVDLGFNYRMTDIQCALGISQLRKLPGFLKRRREIADRYTKVFSSVCGVQPLSVREDVQHAYHLYVVKLHLAQCEGGREGFFRKMQERGIRVNVHYIPVHLHPFYRKRFNTVPGLCPVAEEEYERIVSLPIYPAMKDGDMEKVISAVAEVFASNHA
jgi:UDP-4-amino-4,6-dideoxy-N-acetyl-beta-L-altrosamine transaminase